MSPKPLLAACVLLLAGGIACALFLRSDAAPPSPVATADVPSPKPEPTATPATARTPVAERSEERRPLSVDAEPLTITVVDGETKAPVPGAVVRWFDESSLDYVKERVYLTREEDRLLSDDGDRLADLGGWRTTADASGHARVTLASDTTILAEHGGRHGRLVVRAGSAAPSAGHTIELEPDRVLRVQVLDAAGEPCSGAYVVITGDGPRIVRVSDADGIASVPRVQLLERRAGSTSEGKAWLFFLGVHSGRGVDPAHSVVFSLDDLPAEPLVLHLPPCGTVRVRAEFAGHPVSAIREITLWHEKNHVLESTEAPVEADGWVHFRHVPLGLELDAAAYWLGWRKVTGPRKPGEVVDVIVTTDPTLVTWTGRLLAADRTPVIDQSVSVRIENRGIDRKVLQMRTDASGHFVFALLALGVGERAERISFDWRLRGGPANRAELAPRTLRSGIEDLGDVMPTTPPLLAAGRITGVDGAILDGVTLRVEHHAPSACGTDLWEEVDSALLERAADGVFTIRGAVAPGRHRLVVAGNVQPKEPVEFSLGCTDLVIDLEAGQSLAAGVLLPAGVAPDSMHAELVPPATAAISPPQRERLLQTPVLQRGERHDVLWTSIASGTYTLELRAWAATVPTLCIPNVRAPGPAGGDPRIADIDLRGLLRATKVRLLAADGKPLADVSGAVFPNARPATGRWRGYAVKAAESTLVLPTGPCDLLVCCTGQRPQRMRGAAGEHFTVRMEPWPEVTVTFAGMSPLPEDVSAEVFAVPLAPTEGCYETPSDFFDIDELFAPRYGLHSIERGEARVLLGDGAHRLEVRVARGDLRHNIAVADPPVVFATTNHVVVRIPPEAWQKAIDAVTPRK